MRIIGYLTNNLSRYEFACQCGCGFDTVDFELAIVIQDGCDYFDTTVEDQYLVAGVQIHNTNEG